MSTIWLSKTFIFQAIQFSMSMLYARRQLHKNVASIYLTHK